MSGAGLRGVAADQDGRFRNKESKLMKQMKFPAEFSAKADLTRVNWDVMKPWVAKRVTELLGVEDDVLIGYIYGQLEGQKTVDPRKLQINLTGFLEKNTSLFCKELWSLLVSAAVSGTGIPQRFLDEKAEELRLRREEEARIQARLLEEQQKRQEELRQQAQARSAEAAAAAQARRRTADEAPRRRDRSRSESPRRRRDDDRHGRSRRRSRSRDDRDRDYHVRQRPSADRERRRGDGLHGNDASERRRRHEGGDRRRHEGEDRRRHEDGDRRRHEDGDRRRHGGGDRRRHEGEDRQRHERADRRQEGEDQQREDRQRHEPEDQQRKGEDRPQRYSAEWDTVEADDSRKRSSSPPTAQV